MWRAIRLHPWRLEIVPAAAFALTVYSAYVYQTQAAAFVAAVPELHKNELFARLPFVQIGFVAFLWLVELGTNNSWVRSERKKRFCWVTLVFQVTIIIQACLSYTIASLAVYLKHVASGSPIRASVFIIGVVSGLAITAVLEHTRKCTPQEPEPELPLSPRDSRGGFYRESRMDWWTVTGVMVFLATVVVASGRRDLFSTGDLILLLSTACVGAGLILCLSRTALIVTETTITFWFGLFRIRLPIATVESCVPGRRDDDPKPRGVKRTTWCKRGQSCIEITMKNGRIYRLGALRPSHICQLIGKPPASEQEAETQ